MVQITNETTQALGTPQISINVLLTIVYNSENVLYYLLASYTKAILPFWSKDLKKLINPSVTKFTMLAKIDQTDSWALFSCLGPGWLEKMGMK